jgi:hypothetical protein
LTTTPREKGYRLSRPRVSSQAFFLRPTFARCSVERAVPRWLFRAGNPLLFRSSCITAVILTTMPRLGCALRRPVGPKISSPDRTSRNASHFISTRLISPGIGVGFSRVQEDGIAVQNSVYRSSTLSHQRLTSRSIVLVAFGQSYLLQQLPTVLYPPPLCCCQQFCFQHLLAYLERRGEQ